MSILHNRIEPNKSDADAVAEVIRSGFWATGPVTEKLEKQLAKVCQRKHCIAVSSGISAMRLSLLSKGVGPGDKVGVPAYSCVALPNAILALGATPEPIDINLDTLCISSKSLGRYAKELKCAIAVNTFGMPADFDELKKHNLALIEDCAHGFGYKTLGKQGDLVVISLYATKFLGCGRGGAVLTDDDELAYKIRDIRDYDDKPASPFLLNDKPDDINSALALNRLSYIHEEIKQRMHIAKYYFEALSKSEFKSEITLPSMESERIWYRYTIRVAKPADFIERLEKQSVQARMPVTNWAKNISKICPYAAEAFQSVVSLPIYPSLLKSEQETVVNSIINCFKESGNA